MDRQDNRNNSFICTLQLVDIISANKCRVDTDCPPGQPCNNEGQCVVEGFFEADNPESKVDGGKHDEMSLNPVSIQYKTA